MPLKFISKTEVAEKAKTKTAVKKALPYRELVDEYVANEVKIASVAQLVKRNAEIRQQFDALADTQPAETPVTFEGSENAFVLSEKREVTTVVGGNEAIVKAIGEGTFLEVAKVTLTELKKLLPAKMLEKITKTERAGSRVGKVVPL